MVSRADLHPRNKAKFFYGHRWLVTGGWKLDSDTLFSPQSGTHYLLCDCYTFTYFIQLAEGRGGRGGGLIGVVAKPRISPQQKLSRRINTNAPATGLHLSCDLVYRDMRYISLRAAPSRHALAALPSLAAPREPLFHPRPGLPPPCCRYFIASGMHTTQSRLAS